MSPRKAKAKPAGDLPAAAADGQERTPSACAGPATLAAPSDPSGWESWQPAPGAAIEVRWQRSLSGGYPVQVYAVTGPPAVPDPRARRIPSMPSARRAVRPANEALQLIARGVLHPGASAPLSQLPFGLSSTADGALFRGLLVADRLPDGRSRLTVRSLSYAGGEVPFAVLDLPGSPPPAAPAEPEEPADPAAPAGKDDSDA